MTRHEVIAAYFEAQAQRGKEAAAVTGDDPSREHQVTGLQQLAAYIRGLPEDDERIRDLLRVCATDHAGRAVEVFTPGPKASALIAHFRLGDPAEGCDGFLTRLVKPAAQDWLAFAVARGIIPDILH